MVLVESLVRKSTRSRVRPRGRRSTILHHTLRVRTRFRLCSPIHSVLPPPVPYPRAISDRPRTPPILHVTGDAQQYRRLIFSFERACSRLPVPGTLHYRKCLVRDYFASGDTHSRKSRWHIIKFLLPPSMVFLENRRWNFNLLTKKRARLNNWRKSLRGAEFSENDSKSVRKKEREKLERG